MAGLNWQVCLIYLDDIIVIGRYIDDMVKNSDTVLQRQHDAVLKLKPRKCQVFAKQVEILGQLTQRKSKQSRHGQGQKQHMMFVHLFDSVATSGALFPNLQRYPSHCNGLHKGSNICWEKGM